MAYYGDHQDKEEERKYDEELKIPPYDGIKAHPEAVYHSRNLPTEEVSKDNDKTTISSSIIEGELNEQINIDKVVSVGNKTVAIQVNQEIDAQIEVSNKTNSPNQPTQNPNNPNIQYLPNEEQSQAKINQIQQNKGIDQQQATIEFLTSYLVNNKTGFPPFTSVPSVDKFNQEIESLDFLTYLTTILQPQMEQIKFKPSFATQKNYQELARRIKEEINPSLSSLTSQFPSLTNVNELNNLVETFLSKYFQGNIYAEAIHDELGKQLKISNHQKIEGQKTGNRSENFKFGIALNEFTFKGGSVPSPEPFPKPNDDNPDNPDDNDNPNPEENPLPQPQPNPIPNPQPGRK
ncbi:2033_t:CDS:2 [Funneliformis geosporum]|nr:2033_t:CDS:2 [Funneliformis geosporum]